jgi:hypothetical protein
MCPNCTIGPNKSAKHPLGISRNLSRLDLVDDDQPMHHEFGKRTYLVANVEPLDVDGFRTVQVGTALWAIALLGLLPFYTRLKAADLDWMIWTCVAGIGLGLWGYDYCKRRKTRRVAKTLGESDPQATPPGGRRRAT